MSYGRNDNNYYPMGSTVAKLPAGQYLVQNSMMGPYFVKSEPKTDELLDIPGTPADEVMRDIHAFLAKRAEYERYGFTHRRGYLMYGPPGTGKTSIAQLVARRFAADGGLVFTLPTPEFLPLAARAVARTEPKRNVMMLLEDPDEYELDSPSVLAVLDGTMPVAGLVTVVTTNYKSKMPPRLANRPGRFDRVILVDRISSAVQLAYLETLQARNPGGLAPAAALVQALDGIPLTLAHLKEAFLAHVVMGVSMADIRDRFEKMASTVNDDDGTEGTDSKEVADADDSPFGGIERSTAAPRLPRINFAALRKG